LKWDRKTDDWERLLVREKGKGKVEKGNERFRKKIRKLHRKETVWESKWICEKGRLEIEKKLTGLR